MRICKIYDGDYPWDVRVEKITSTLVKNGHEVHLLCRNLKKRPVYEYLNKVHIYRLPYSKYSYINNILGFPAFFNPLWLLMIYRIVRKYSADLILVRDLPIALSAVFIGRLCRLPVIIDMAEDYPAMVRHILKSEGFNPMNLIIRNPFLVECIEALCVSRVDRIFTVILESKSRLMDQYHLDRSRIHIVSNTPRLSDVNMMELTDRIPEPSRTIKLIYIGGLQEARNLDVVLKGMAVNTENIDCTLTILGTGRGEDNLKKLVKTLRIQNKVIFKGWVEHNAIGNYLRTSDIGIIPHAVTKHTNTTVPNKLFDYMAYAKPVLASDTKPVQRIIDSECCGLIYRYDSPEDFRDKLGRLTDRKIRASMGANGRKAIELRYNWELDSGNLLDAIEKCTLHQHL